MLKQRTRGYYATATMTHFMLLAYLSYFFRYRRLTKVQVLAVGSVYFYAFGYTNNILYKAIVDRKVIGEAKRMNQHRHIQPNGELKARGLNF